MCRQNRVMNRIRSRCISQFKTAENFLHDALKTLLDDSSKLHPQGSIHKRNEQHHIEYFRSAVVGNS